MPTCLATSRETLESRKCSEVTGRQTTATRLPLSPSNSALVFVPWMTYMAVAINVQPLPAVMPASDATSANNKQAGCLRKRSIAHPRNIRVG